MTYTKVAEGLTEPMGLKYVDGTIYVSEKDGLTALVDTDGDEVADEHDTIATWPFGGNYHEFAFGLLYEDGYFYVTTGIAMVPGGNSLDPQLAENRGSVMKISRETGEVEYVAGGLRTPNGLGWGADGGMYVTDNQGVRIPTSKLVRVEEGAFYNHFTNPDGPYDDQPVTEPVLWMPHSEISNSPSNPVVLTEGVFAGQLAIGDVTYGGLQRAYLEDVAGQEQGAVFRMTQGLESGVSRTSVGPDGAIYVGGIGWSGNWGQAGKLSYGLQKLTYDDNHAFDMLAMRAVEGGFEIEYTQPLSEETAQDLASRYTASQWRYVATPQYGGPKVDEEDLDVTAAAVSADRKTVTLQVDGLKPGRVVNVHSPTLRVRERTGAVEHRGLVHAHAPAGRLRRAARLRGRGRRHLRRCRLEQQPRRLLGQRFRRPQLGAGRTDHLRGPHRGGRAPRPRDPVRQRTEQRPATDPAEPEPVRQRREAQAGLVRQHRELVGLGDAGRDGAAARGCEHHHDPARRRRHRSRQPRQPHGHPERTHHALRRRRPGRVGRGQRGGPATWPIADGSFESFGGDIRTKERFDDFRMHIEWYQPEHGPEVTGQARGNSGVYIQERYEVQVLESFGIDPPKNNDAGPST